MASKALPETKHTPGLVDRLYDRRGVCTDGFPSTFGDDLCREAAEEVLRLLAGNERLREALRRAGHLLASRGPSAHIYAAHAGIIIESALSEQEGKPAGPWGECARCNGVRDKLAEGREPEELCDPCYEDSTRFREQEGK